MEQIWRGAGEAERRRRRGGGQAGGEWRGLGLPAIRATGGGRRATDLRRSGGVDGGGRGLGVEAWSGSGEERGRWSAEETRRSHGGARAGNGGRARVTSARGRPLPLMWPAGSGWRASWASCSRAGPRAESGRTLTVPGRAGPRACGAAQARHDARAGPGRVPGPILVLRAGPRPTGLMENYTRSTLLTQYKLDFFY